MGLTPREADEAMDRAPADEASREGWLAAERSFLVVRWIAVPFGWIEISTYGAMPYPPGVELLAHGLVGVLLATNVVAALLVRRVGTVQGARWLAVATLASDVVVVTSLVWLYAFDDGSVHFLLLFLLPAEGAVKLRLPGALGVWALSTLAYTGQEVWAAEQYGHGLSHTSIVFRMGILLLVALAMGLFAQKLERQHTDLRAALRELEQERQWTEGLIDMLAHDLRSPLGTATSLMRQVDEYADQVRPDQLRQLTEAAIRQNQRTLRLADDLLAMARARTSELQLDIDEVHLAELVDQVATGLAEGRGWWRQDIPPELRVRADRARLEQVLANLLSNARRHGRPPVTVRARGVPDAGEVSIAVSDAGDGMSEERIASLFEPFASGARSDSVGLGLWVVRTLVEAHGGGVGYDEVDERPTFTVTLPGQVVEAR